MRESGIVLYDDLFISASLGTSCHVEFDFFKIWNFKNTLKNFNPSLLRFYHVHPSGFLNYSKTDLNCIKGFNISFGYPVYFAILTFKNDNMNDLTHDMVAFMYLEGNMEKIPIYPIDLKYLFLLKTLSYSEIYYGDD